MSVYKGEKLVAGGSIDTHFVRKPVWSQAVEISAGSCDAHISFVPYKAQ